MNKVIFFLVCVALAGCGRQVESPVVNIAIRNESSRAVDWVELEWPGPHVPGGIIPPGAGKTSLGVPWRSAKTGILTFVDDESRKPSRVEISFVDIDSRIASRPCKTVIIAILGDDKDVVRCE